MNTFGNIFRISNFGQSHSSYIGVTIDGCPAGISITPADFIADLDRRKSSNYGTTPRVEADIPSIVSGVFDNKSTGTPITILFSNFNTQSEDYNKSIVRPSTSDFVANHKYNGFNDYRGNGTFSGRATIGLVTAGVIAKKIIPSIKISSKIITIGGEPYSNATKELVETTMNNGDSLGGVIECTIKNTPIGLGEPFFDGCESMLAHLLFSIPGIKGIEFGSGFAISNMKGSEANDCYINSNGKTETNNSGGMNAGISNGNDIIFRIAARPTPSFTKTQITYNFQTNKMEELSINGRHDTCFALRLPVIAEAVAAIVLADLSLCNK